jgi:hypothetical protein
MWRPLQAIGKARVPKRLHEGRPMRRNFSVGLHNYRSSDMLKTSICAPHSCICVVRYDSIYPWRGCFTMLTLLFSRAFSTTYNCLAGRLSRVRKAVLFLGMFHLHLRSPSNQTNSCFRSDKEHDSHACDTGLCPVRCELCNQLCHRPHLHGLTPGANHLCGSVYYMHILLRACDKLYFVQIEGHICVWKNVRPWESAKFIRHRSP